VERDKGMLQKEKGETKFQNLRNKCWSLRGRERYKTCCRGRREKGSFRNKMMVAEKEENVIKACCRRRREKGSFIHK
jgi:hypothetical protein